MALPTSTITFTGTDNTALATYNANFTLDSGTLQIYSGGAGSASFTSQHGLAHWNADTFDGDHYAQATASYRNSGSGGGFTGIAVRVSGSGGTLQGYGFRWNGGNVDAVSYLVRISGGTFTQVVPDGQADIYLDTGPAQGTVVKLLAEGSAVKVYYDGVLQYTYTDGTPITGGAAGIYGYGYSLGDALIDNWTGGNMNAASTPIAALSGNHARRRRA